MNALPRRWSPTWTLALWALGLVALHVAMIIYTFGLPLLPEIAYNRGDFSTHAAQVQRVLQAWETAGRTWAYDVQLLAGAPNGAIFDADNKGWELWTWLWIQLGVSEARAFNSFALAVHGMMPLVVYAAARLFRLDRAQALMVTTLAVAFWWFDSFTHWMWFAGTISYVFVSYFALLPLALFHRWIIDRRIGFAVGCALTLAFAHFVHPYIFFILVVPMTAEYARAARRDPSFGRRDHLITVAIGLTTVLVNAAWLRVALDFVPYLLDSSYYMPGGAEYLVYDFFGLLMDVDTQGVIGPRTAFRTVALVAAFFALRSWRRSGDRRWFTFAISIAALVALTFFGAYTVATQIQPYRHNLPLGFALLIPAGVGLTWILRARPWRGLDAAPAALALLVGLLALQHLSRDVLYFFAPSLPKEQVIGGFHHNLNALGHIYTHEYRYDSAKPSERWGRWEELIAWIDEQDDGRSRWLVQHQGLGEYVTARTDAQVIGGFRLRNVAHSDANWFRRAGPAPPYDADEMRRYLDTYGIRWIVVQRATMGPWWDQQRDLFVRARALTGHVVLRVLEPTRLIEGEGEVQARINQLRVTGTPPDQDVVLRYHWMETLRCEPDCSILRESVEGDRVGFIRVPAPHPADFEIRNTYEWPD